METIDFMRSLSDIARYEKEFVERRAARIAEQSMSKLNRFISASGDVRIQFEKLNKSVENLDLVTSSAENEEFIKMAASMMKADEKLLREAREYVKRYNDATGNTFKNEVLRIFKVAFNGAKARNIEIFAPAERKGYYNKITIGPNGFGMRPNVQSYPVSKFEELRYIVENKDEVIKGLKRNNIVEQAIMFKKFIELIPELSEEGRIGVDMVKKVVIPREYENDVRSLPLLAEKIFFTDGMKLIFSVKSRWGNNFQLYYEGTGRKIRGKDALVYMQVSPYMKKYVSEYVAIVKPAIEKSKVAIERLRKEFGRQLLIDAI